MKKDAISDGKISPGHFRPEVNFDLELEKADYSAAIFKSIKGQLIFPAIDKLRAKLPFTGKSMGYELNIHQNTFMLIK